MERNTKTTAGNLQPGDRFYKTSDKKKTVLEVQIVGAMVTVIEVTLIRLSYPEKIRTETGSNFFKTY